MTSLKISKSYLLISNTNNEFPLRPIIAGDFNDRCSRWWKNVITNLTEQEIDSLISSAGYKQIIDKPTHVINNSMSCIDLIFCTDQNVISNYCADVSVFKKCHNNIIHGKIDIRVPLPPAYVREICDHNKENVGNIKKNSI